VDESAEPWEQLVADLESQADLAQAEQVRGQVEELVRADRLAGSWLERLRGARGRTVAVAATGLGVTAGTLLDNGPDWLSMATPPGQTVVVIDAVQWVRGLGAASVPDALVGALERRWRLALLLGQLSRRRRPLTLVLRDGTRLVGTLDRAGADYAELAEHPAGEWARPQSVVGRRVVPYRALAAVLLRGD
jgi:hypothetical protein